MEFESSSWIKDGVYFYPHLFGGGINDYCALLSFSTSYFGMISVPTMPHLFPDLRVFHKKKSAKKRVRVYMDGCFDLMHTTANQQETSKGTGRLNWLALVSGLKWVDEVIPNAPYEITEEFMNRLFKEHKIDYIIHGDDPCLLPDGTDAYALAKKVGRYKQIKRTEGVSSTDIVGRILSCIKDAKSKEVCLESYGEFDNLNNTQLNRSLTNGGHISHFLPTSRRIVQFSNGKGPGPNSRVVYIDGAFDLFHAGHVEILKRARQHGDFLLVGIYSDQTVSELRGSHFPLMNLHERSLSVLACRYVDEVIIGAPWEVTKDMITTFNISLVVRGTISEKNPLMNGKSDPYVVPKSMGIFQMLESPKDITTTSIAKRIIANHEIYLVFFVCFYPGFWGAV
ncbi:UNVERIFIED_CONTAM: Ethanolamine-phosphate cytidylyltransferase [Sesamum calycinum]|uniref:ethanolamine-phosphate cytidylyltransferase n=1 Tax=Sesamum calycinum TaxID=2727403 RepID=A0AAW2NWH4_9LAMI